MRFSQKSECLIGNFHQKITCLAKLCFLILKYRKSVLKKTQIFRPLFEPCSSCVAVDSFLQKKRVLDNRDSPKGKFYVILDSFCSSVPMTFFLPSASFFCPSAPRQSFTYCHTARQFFTQGHVWSPMLSESCAILKFLAYNEIFQKKV